MKNIRLVMVTLLVTISTVAQNSFDNHQKYWFLRAKLRNDFMKVGIGQGHSLPFVQRGFRTKYNAGTSQLDYTTWMKGGDIIAELGQYIGVLATEYAILNQNGQNTDSTSYELYCALNAVNRLDYMAEPMYSKPSDLDGFLVRDDIPKRFILDNYRHFNYYTNWDGLTTDPGKQQIDFPLDTFNVPNTLNADKGFSSQIAKGQWEVSTDYRENYEYAKDYKNLYPNETEIRYKNYAMSQDHVISLLYGLTLLKRLVPASANYHNMGFHYGEGGTTFHDVAANIADRVVTHIKNNSWRIKKPNGSLVSPNEGGAVGVYGYALSEIAANLNLQHFSFGTNPPHNNAYYHNFESLTTGYTLWQSAAHSSGMTFDLITQIAELSASCNCLWGYTAGYAVSWIQQTLTKVWKWLGRLFGWAWQVVETVMSYFVPAAYHINTTTGMLPNATYTNPNDPKPNMRIFYPQDHALLAHKLINAPNASLLTNDYNIANNRVEARLNTCPCNGPSNFNNGTNAYWDHSDWSGYSLIEHTNTNEMSNTFQGEYNGLDYMLLHNLYYLNNASGDIVDLSSRYINFSFPLSYNNEGSASNPKTIGAFEYIVGDNTLNSNADVQYRAGKQITLKHGFTANAGSNFNARIAPYNCSNDYRNSNMRTTHPPADSGRVSLTDMTAVPTHSVKGLPPGQPFPEIKPMQYTPSLSAPKVKKVINLNDQVQVFPNPAKHEAYIRVESANPAETYVIKLYNNNGQLLKWIEHVYAVDNLITLEISEINESLCLLEIRAALSGRQWTEKIIIQGNN